MKKDFMKLNNLKKINKDLNDFISQIKYEDNESALSFEWKGFVRNQFVGRDINGVSPVVTLQTITHECDAIKLSKFTDSFLNIFIKSRGYSSLEAREDFFLITFKDLNGKLVTVNELNRESFIKMFGVIYAEEIEYKKVSGYDNVISFPMNDSHHMNTEKEDLTDDSLRTLIYNLKYHETKAVENFFKSHGLEYVDSFQYTQKYSLCLDKVKETSDSIIFASKTMGTYQSLPEMITIKKTQEIKLHQLSELGLEWSGYHDHSTKMLIKDEDKKEALAFKKIFASI